MTAQEPGDRPAEPVSLGPHPKESSGESSDDRLQGLAGRSRFGSLIHKIFFRDAHDREQSLLDLANDIDRIYDEKELVETVGHRLTVALAPSQLHIFCRRGQRFRLLFSTVVDDDSVMIPDSFSFLTPAANEIEPRALRRAGGLSADERGWLRTWGADWLVPLAHPPRNPRGIHGFVLLGECPGEYSPVQLDLLDNLARRVGRRLSDLGQQRRQKLMGSQGEGRWLKECPQCHRCYSSETLFCPLDDQVLRATVLIDQLLGGRYLLERRLARGGMATIYRGRDQSTGAVVAIKLLTGGDQVAFGRFANEARAGQVVRHPNIVPVLDSGVLKEESAYLVMEFVEGRTLRQVLDAEMPIKPQRVALWFDQILDGVTAAHALGIIHRDLKPDNIMITLDEGREVVKILDFGLAKLRREHMGSQQLTLTAAGMVIGTLSYMSPEQLAADAVDHRADMFSLAVMASEALTGKTPFFAKNLGQMLRAVASEPYSIEVTSPAQAHVAEILGRALAKAPTDRYEDVFAWRRDLIPALERCEEFPAPESRAT